MRSHAAGSALPLINTVGTGLLATRVKRCLGGVVRLLP
jgi:hypothetical protein